MEVQQLLLDFYDAIEEDVRIRATHISLYLALVLKWRDAGFNNPLAIAREEVMKGAKISARCTYHKNMKELHEFGYIQYAPSFRPSQRSVVYIRPLQMAKPASGPKQLLKTTNLHVWKTRI